MARRRTANADPFEDLDRKLEILEQELAVQRAALDRLKELAAPNSKEGCFDPRSTGHT